MYNVKIIADYVIDTLLQKDIHISNFKLQSILIYIQAAFFDKKNVPCFDENITIWNTGLAYAVILPAYRRYAYYSGNWILFPRCENTSEYIADEDKDLIDLVVNELKDYSARELSDSLKNKEFLDYFVDITRR